MPDGAASLPFDVRPLEEAVPLYVDWLRRILLLKAAPEPDQLADRLDGGPWQGLELGLNAAHVASDERARARRSRCRCERSTASA